MARPQEFRVTPALQGGWEGLQERDFYSICVPSTEGLCPHQQRGCGVPPSTERLEAPT